MASKESSGQPVCLVCLEAHDTLKVVPVCKHVFCRGCLLKHIESQGSSTESFPCPTCHVHSAFTSEEGIDGFTDYDDSLGGEETLGSVTTFGACGGVNGGGSKQGNGCHICQFNKDIEVKADTLCDECGQFYLCGECTKIHAKNPATANHVVKSLKSLKKRVGDLCKVHKKHMSRFCFTCSKPCCNMCVFLEHGDHDVKAIGDAFRSLVEDLKNATEGQEKRSTNFRKCEGQLKLLNASEVSRKKDTLLQEIENHAERCIEQIIKQKDALKEQVLTKYEAVTEVSEWINKLPGLQVLDKIVPKAKQVLSEAGPHPDDLQQLSLMLKQVTDVRIDDDVAVRLDGYWDTCESLFWSPMSFVPTNTSYKIGDVKEITRSLKNDKLVYEKRLEVDNDAKFIPSVANLGNDLYAVAHPILQGQTSNGIDVYKFPGELQRTITDQVPPFYDMVATPAGEIAVLSDGSKEGSLAVRLFDPEQGYTRTTNDVAVRCPLSFCINRFHQYVILSCDGTKRVITLFNEDGSVEFTYVVAKADGVEEARSISCSASFIYLLGKEGVIAVYREQDKQLVLVDVNKQYKYNFMDISACLFGGVTVCFNFTATDIYLFRYAQSHQPYKLQQANSMAIPNAHSGAYLESRLSVRSEYTVWSRGNTIRVLKES